MATVTDRRRAARVGNQRSGGVLGQLTDPAYREEVFYPALLDFGYDLAPGTGEVRSGLRADAAFGRAGQQIEQGQYLPAAGSLAEGTAEYLGAIPALGFAASLPGDTARFLKRIMPKPEKFSKVRGGQYQDMTGVENMMESGPEMEFGTVVPSANIDVTQKDPLNTMRVEEGILDTSPVTATKANKEEFGPQTWRTNLFRQVKNRKRKDGSSYQTRLWSWVDKPEGVIDNAPVVSLHKGSDHVYVLDATYDNPTVLDRSDQARLAMERGTKIEEPSMKPKTRGSLYLGKKVGTIKTPQGIRDVYDQAAIAKPGQENFKGLTPAPKDFFKKSEGRVEKTEPMGPLLGRKPVSKNPTTQQRLDDAYERHGDKIYMDPEGLVTGSLRLEDNIPLTFRGKEPNEWNADEAKEFGDKFGKKFAPSEKELQQNLLEVPLEGGGTLKIPGGFEGEFTPYEQHFLHSQGVDPNLMQTEDYWKMHDKMIRSVDPGENLTDEQIYNQIIFGLTSPNNPLTPNQLAVGRLRANDMQDIERMSDMIPWNYQNADERIQEIADGLTTQKMDFDVTTKPQRNYVKSLGIKLDKDQKRVSIDTHMMDGKPLLNSAGLPIKNKKSAVKNFYSKQIADSFGVGAGERGGIGASGSADYTDIAMFAQMFRDRPDFFRKAKSEDWPGFVERVSNQIKGLDYKTGYMGTVWQDPMGAMNAPVDRHIAFAWLKDPGSADLRKSAVSEWNRMTEFDSPRNPVFGKDKVSNFDELENAPGGNGFAVTYAMNQAYMPKKSGVFRGASGEMNPNLPEQAGKIDWIKEPESFETVPENYKKALEASFTGKGGDRKVFNQQWGEWDLIRKRISPHETINPDLQGLPRMSIEQMKDVDKSYKEHRYKSPKIKGETVPTFPAKNPMDFFYSGMQPEFGLLG